MRWSVVLVCACACGCNAIFGVHPAQQQDGQTYFDGEPDAPYTCPAYGQPPVFGRGLFEAFAQNCTDYSIGETAAGPRAMALCSDQSGPHVSYGPIDSLAATTIPTTDATMMIRSARLAPEGDQAVLAIDEGFVPKTSFQVFQLQPDGGWTSQGELATAPYGCFCAVTTVSTPTRGPNRHLLLYDYTGGQLIELEDRGTYPWTQLYVQPITDFGQVQIASAISLSPDGLRMVFSANSPTGGGIYYSDRQAMLAPFEPPIWLSALPSTSGTDPFLTEDCSHLYLSGLGAVFFAKQ